MVRCSAERRATFCGTPMCNTSAGELVRTATHGDASGGHALTGRVNAPVNANRRPIQKARDRFPGAGLILAMVNICR
jgi:hypothetical protein